MKIVWFLRKISTKDDSMAAFHKHIVEMAKLVEHIDVICWEYENDGLPSNVAIHKCGREKTSFNTTILKTTYDHLKKLVPNCDVVYTQMCPEYAFAASPFCKAYNKPLVVWHCHVDNTTKTKLLPVIADVVVTSSKNSFRGKQNNVRYIGQGINTKQFINWEEPRRKEFLMVGRYTKARDIEIVLYALQYVDAKIHIIGNKDVDYFEEFIELAVELGVRDKIHVIGSVSNRELVRYYNEYDYYINTLKFGGFGKSNLEAMSCGCFPILRTEDVKEIFPEGLYFDNYKELASIMNRCLSRTPSEADRAIVRESVLEQDTVLFIKRLHDVLCDVIINRNKGKVIDLENDRVC